MSILAHLPEKWSTQFLSKWCSLRDVGKIDTSICCTKHRPVLLKLFDSSILILNSAQATYGCYFWMCMRKIKYDTLTLDREFFIHDSAPRIILNNFHVKAMAISDCDRDFLKDSELIRLVNSCPSLEIVSFENVDCVTDDVLSHIKPRILCQFTKVRLSRCKNLEGTFMHYLATHCIQISYLKINHCCGMTSEKDLILLLGANGATLTYMSLHFTFPCVTNQLLHAIESHCTELTECYLENCCILHLPAALSLTKLHLARLQIQFLIEEDLEKEDSEEQQGCLEYNSNRFYTDREVQSGVMICGFNTKQFESCSQLVTFFGLPHVADLTHIQLVDIQGMSDDLLTQIGETQLKLVSLGVNRCDEFYSTSGLQKVLFHCRQLTELGLDYCDHLSNSHLITLFATLNDLKTLKICNDTKLTADCISSILSHNPHITHFVCIGCRHLQKTHFVHLRITHPEVTIEWEERDE